MLDLEGLERLTPWNTLEMEVVAAVNSGFEALDYLQNHKVDVLISDIKMPIMSGLETVRRALETSPKLKVVFISGYEDFQYAKQAISLNAFGYVLKPVDDQELIRVLTDVHRELNEEAQQLKMENVLKKTVHQAQDEMLMRWLSGSAQEEELPLLTERLADWTHSGPCRIAVLELDDVGAKVDRLPEGEKQAVLAKTVQTLLSVCESEAIPYVCKGEGYRFALVLSQASGRMQLERVLKHMSLHAPLSVTAGWGCAANEHVHLPGSYQVALELVSYKIFCGKNRIIDQEDIGAYQAQDIMNVDGLLDVLFVAIANYDLVKVDDCLEQVYENVKRIGKKKSVYNVTLHVIAKLDAFLFGMNENLRSILGMDINQLDVLYDFETVKDIQSWLRRKLFEISEMLQLKKLRKNRKLVEEIEAYVLNHLDSNLTLRDVANYFSFSPNYLGHLFKEEKEENFSDFVIRKRLERASELLMDPKLKIYEIADRVGYKSWTYFSRQFKEKFGTTPGEFRRKS